MALDWILGGWIQASGFGQLSIFKTRSVYILRVFGIVCQSDLEGKNWIFQKSSSEKLLICISKRIEVVSLGQRWVWNSRCVNIINNFLKLPISGIAAEEVQLLFLLLIVYHKYEIFLWDIDGRSQAIIHKQRWIWKTKKVKKELFTFSPSSRFLHKEKNRPNFQWILHLSERVVDWTLAANKSRCQLCRIKSLKSEICNHY